MNVHKRAQQLIALLCLAVVAPAALATNGYFANGYGTRNKGMAGAGVALPQDSMAAATNPAGMAFVGARSDLGVAIFSPSPRSYTSSGSSGVPDGTSCGIFPGGFCPFDVGPQSIESDNDYFLVPHFGYNLSFGNTAMGISVYGNGGMDTEYKGGTASLTGPTGTRTTFPGTFGAGNAGINLSQLFIAPTYASKFSPTAAWGVSPIIAYQRFKAFGLGNFAGFSTSPNDLSDKGADSSTGFGVRVGVQGAVAPGLTLAGAYQMKINMSEFDKYKGLFAEGGDFDIPANATVGLAWQVTPTSHVVFDIRKIWYSKVDSVGNPHSQLATPAAQCTPGPTGGTGAGCLGGSNGAGFGWQDVTVYKLGYQWKTGADYTWRVGLSVGDQPIPDSEVLFNILAPAVSETEVSFGFTKAFGKNNALSFAFTHALENSVKGPNPFSPSTTPGGGQTIDLEMKQYDVELSWAWIF